MSWIADVLCLCLAHAQYLMNVNPCTSTSTLKEPVNATTFRQASRNWFGLSNWTQYNITTPKSTVEVSQVIRLKVIHGVYMEMRERSIANAPRQQGIT
jgi:hypothetical protein